MTRRLVFAAAVLVLAAAGYAQAVAYHTPAPTPAATDPTTLPAGCDGLRLEYSRRHSMWKSSVKFGHESAAELAVMRAILREVGRLERRGVCGG